MLLDEADVWLERCMVSDLKRNTLVAGIFTVPFSYNFLSQAIMKVI